ncbi:MAG: DNA modification methylase [Planctomycetes bacterium]|nr:DNA modification methylase [Planctomycetota bacterium]
MELSNNTRSLSALQQSFTSIVSYPDRVAAWGDARYRGNCDGRLFLNLVLRYGPRRVADPMLGSGTTRDVVEWLNQHSTQRVEYWGSDLRKGFNLWTNDLPGTFDLVWLHPPYFNIISYSDKGEDLSNIDDYGHFRQASASACSAYASLALGGRLAVLVGDVRRKGKYIPIVRDVLNWEGELGQLRAVIIKAQHNCRSDGVNYARMEDPRIQHEYCVLFKKPVIPEPARSAA